MWNVKTKLIPVINVENWCTSRNRLENTGMPYL
jgi:hypothetical protein